tara:strand:- start:8466 stop:9527 length:1062 start_codon:yes stop_codon:yes gene_type:complete
MANVTIKTNLLNITDSQSSTTSVSLDGVPNTSSAIITSRKFTPNTDCVFSKVPVISFQKTSEPNNYNYTLAKDTVDNSYTFTVNYRRPLTTLPTTDVIEFFAEAVNSKVVTTGKIYSYKMNISDIRPKGESRLLQVFGDHNTKFKLAVTTHPRLSPEARAQFIQKEEIATIPLNGKFEKAIKFPESSLTLEYRILLSEFKSGTFSGQLTKTPTTIFIDQWPLQQTKLEIIETSDTSWTLPANTVTNKYYYFSNTRGATTHKAAFSFSCSHSNAISADGTFTADDFTQVTGQSSTNTDPTVASIVSYDNLTYTIDNSPSPKTVVISGEITIKHGYDAGGHTYITLNINDILNHA